MKKKQNKKNKKKDDLKFYIITEYKKDKTSTFGPFKSYKKAEKYLVRNCNYFFQYTIDTIKLKDCIISLINEDVGKHWKLSTDKMIEHEHFGMDWDLTTKDTATLCINWPDLPWDFHVDRCGNEIQVSFPKEHASIPFENSGINIAEEHHIYPYLALEVDPYETFAAKNKSRELIKSKNA